MSANITKTSLALGLANDSLAIIDVYKQKNSPPINNIPSTNAKAKKAAETYRNQPSLAKVSAAKAQGGIIGALPSALELVDRLSKLSNDARGPIQKLPPATLTEMLTTLGQNPNSELATLFVDGQKYTNKKYKDVDSLANLISSITGNAQVIKVLDLEGENALFGTIIKSAIALGVPKAIDQILDKISDEKLRKKLMVDNLEISARMSDLVTVNKVLDEIGVEKALTKVPKLINVLLTFYRIPETKKPESIASLKTKLLTLLNRINPTWSDTTRNGVTIKNLEPFTYSSKDARTLFTTDDNYRTLAMIAPTYKSENVMRLLRRSYPKAGFSSL